MVDTERAAAQQRIASNRSSQTTAINSDKAVALAEADATRDQRRESAQSLYDDETLPQGIAQGRLPSIVNNKEVKLGVIAGPVSFLDLPLTLVDKLTASFIFGDNGGGAGRIAGVADELYVYTGAASAVDMAKHLIRAEISYQADRIRQLPRGDELVEYTGILWSLTRQQAALNAQGVRNRGQSLSAGIAEWGAGGGGQWYGLGVFGSTLAEGAFGLVAGLFDPISTAEGLAGVADAHYRAGGTLAVVGAFTGGLSVYEAATGTDFLTGQALSGADRFDRGMLGTSAILTGIGASGLVRNIAIHGLRATFTRTFASAPPTGHPAGGLLFTTPAMVDDPNAGVKFLVYRPSSGVVLKGNPGLTTTIVGNHGLDMYYVVVALGRRDLFDFGPNPGGFNVLYIAGAKGADPRQFWLEVNRPWLDAALARGDVIVFATKPEMSVLSRFNQKTNKFELTGFGREYLHLRKNGLPSQL